MKFARSVVVTAFVGLVLPTTAWTQVGSEAEIVVIRAGRLFDTESGTIVEGMDLRIEGRRIVAVGPDLTAPHGSRVIDLRDRTVLPGLIDLHAHLLFAQRPGRSLTGEGLAMWGASNDLVRVLEGASRAGEYLSAGFTSVRDLGNSGRYGDVALRRGVGRLFAGAAVYPSGPGLATYGAQFAGLGRSGMALAEHEYRIVRGSVDAREAVREHVHHGAMVIKVYANNSPNPRAGLGLDELEAVVRAGRASYVPVAAHATFDGAIHRAVEAGVSTIEHGYGVSDSTLALMADRDVPLVATDMDSVALVAWRRAEGALDLEEVNRILQRRRDRLIRARRAGVTIAFGSDAYLELGWTRGELARRTLYAYVDAGMPEREALRTATVIAARVLRNRGIGVLKPGARADVIAVAGNPLEEIRALEKVVFVMRDGVVHRHVR